MSNPITFALYDKKREMFLEGGHIKDVLWWNGTDDPTKAHTYESTETARKVGKRLVGQYDKHVEKYPDSPPSNEKPDLHIMMLEVQVVGSEPI